MRDPLVRRLLSGCVAALLLVAVAGCGDDDASDSPETTAAADAATTTEAEGTSAAALEVTETDLGEIVVDGETGRTLYAFTPDSETTSTCNDACAAAWPPLAGPAEAGDGVDEALLGTITRDDGSTQAAYGGHPLYLYAEDAAPGDTTGQGSGDKWFVIDPGGATVTEEATASSGSDDVTTTTAGDRYGY